VDDQPGERSTQRIPSAEREGKLVGFLVATVEKEIPIYRLDSFGFIHDVWVERNTATKASRDR